jgi:ribonuclease Z
MFGVTILGNNSALPAYDRHPTAQLVTLNEQLFLIDCGEGTQMQISRYRIRHSKFGHIFISHLHGDHYFGLIGLITSMGLLGREHPLNLYGPPPLKDIIEMQLKVANTNLPFTLVFHPLEKEGLILDHPKYSVSCFETRHRIPCYGFLISEKRNPRKIIREQVIQKGIPASFYDQLKKGHDYINKNGEVIRNETVTYPNLPNSMYAFCADTMYTESIAEKVKNANLLYHETTYLKDLEERATARFHSTTVQAAKFAIQANAKKLLIGHFSSKYEKLDEFLMEAKSVFENTDLALEGVSYRIDY